LRNKTVLVEKTAANPTGDFTVDLSSDTPVIVLDAGAVPVGHRILASYSTLGAQKSDNPYLLIEGKQEGSVYGRMIDEDMDLYSGVEVEVTADADGEFTVTFYKPTEK